MINKSIINLNGKQADLLKMQKKLLLKEKQLNADAMELLDSMLEKKVG